MGLEVISRLKKERGLTNAQLSALSGVTLSTLDKLTSGANTNPKLDTLLALCRALGCTLNEFMDAPVPAQEPAALSGEAEQVARDYESLDRHGRYMVRLVVQGERKRMEEAPQAAGEEPPEPARLIPLYYTPAAAGMASPAEGEDFDYIEAAPGGAAWGADFAVKIAGDSMEPYIADGSVVYVRREPLEDGDVGIFCVDGDMLCKQYRRDAGGDVRLLSLNRKRADADRFLPRENADAALSCYGRVLLPRRPPF